MSTEEKVYMAKSLKFINSYKINFSPVLTNIASNLNAKKNNKLIEAMNAIKKTKKKDDTNSNLKDLITLLSAYAVNSDEVTDYKTDNGDIDHAAYVKQTLELMNIKKSKERYYNLLFGVMQDMKNNRELMALVQKFKHKNTDWKKMVGMLIPKGARVKINDIILTEGISNYSYYRINNKKTPITSNQLIGTVVERAMMTGNKYGYGYGGEFLKIVSLPKDILRHKKDHKKEFKPEEIELHDSQPETLGEEEGEEEGEGEETAAEASAAAKASAAAAAKASTKGESSALGASAAAKASASSVAAAVVAASSAPATAVPAKPEQGASQQGGQQRTTRKHKNAIIGSAKKSRTNR
jgi:hypothetical protein